MVGVRSQHKVTTPLPFSVSETDLPEPRGTWPRSHRGKRWSIRPRAQPSSCPRPPRPGPGPLSLSSARSSHRGRTPAAGALIRLHRRQGQGQGGCGRSKTHPCTHCPGTKWASLPGPSRPCPASLPPFRLFQRILTGKEGGRRRGEEVKEAKSEHREEGATSQGTRAPPAAGKGKERNGSP